MAVHRSSFFHLYPVIFVLVSISFTQNEVSARIDPGPPTRLTDAAGSVMSLILDRFDSNSLLLGNYFNLMRYSRNVSRIERIAGSDTIKGYREGESARFDEIRGIAQLDTQTLVVSDSQNNCLRKITGSITSTYAGECEKNGYADSTLSNSLMARPGALLLDEQLLYFVDSTTNGRIRVINTVAGTTSTIVSNFYYPSGLACDPQLGCEVMYTTSKQSVYKIDQTDSATLQLLSGSPSGRFGVSGESLGSVEDARFRDPTDLTFVDHYSLAISDTNNHRIVILDFENDTSYELATSINSYSLSAARDTLYVGTYVNKQSLYEISLVLRSGNTRGTKPSIG